MDKIILDIERVLSLGFVKWGLIICHPTGIFYTNQVGHNGCEHPQAEGFSLGIDPYMSGFSVDDCEWLDAHEHKISMGNEINDELLKLPSCDGLSCEIDFDRINELVEAWWPVKVKWHDESHWADSYSYMNKAEDRIKIRHSKGYITHPNCD